MTAILCYNMQMKQATAIDIMKKLELLYPDAAPALEYGSAFELLVAVILSAQCTDVRVNKVTSEMFPRYNRPEHFASMEQSELERMIYTCGFYRNKAAHIISASRSILERFGGEVPRTREELESLAGVGRKTANVVYSVAFGGDAIAVDTHVFRVSNRIGLAHAKDPLQTERQLCELLPQNMWSLSHHLLIFHGRNICKSQRPLCASCPVAPQCSYYTGAPKSKPGQGD